MAGGKAVAKEGEKVAGGFLKKMLGKLIRPAEKITGKAGAKDAAKDAAKLAERDKALRDAMDTNVRDLKKHDLWDKAGKERDKLYNDLAGKSKAERKKYLREREDLPRDPSKNGPVSVTGATDPETGISKAGVNHKSSNPPLGGCAEDDALDRINQARAERGLDPVSRNDVYYSKAQDLNGPPGEEFPICNRNCQNVTDPDRYPPGTTPMGDPTVTDPTDRKWGRWFHL